MYWDKDYFLLFFIKLTIGLSIWFITKHLLLCFKTEIIVTENLLKCKAPNMKGHVLSPCKKSSRKCLYLSNPIILKVSLEKGILAMACFGTNTLESNFQILGHLYNVCFRFLFFVTFLKCTQLIKIWQTSKLIVKTWILLVLEHNWELSKKKKVSC